ncbi:MAG: leucyl/phenylalanyl-tRNA--protein transferase [Bacteroidetes bacterium]|nr:leucyl/phenylalanyl-tRNA--protein transferase [Bacteroidota bacterium]
MFPMADEKTGKINWYEPEKRAILPLYGLRISKSLNRKIKHKTYSVTFDKSFREVITNCSKRTTTWISDEIIESYQNLFSLGYVHSVETWKRKKLVGGLYGVSIGGAFFGESMFSVEVDASKVALVNLVEHLNKKNFILVDCQFMTSHLKSLGAIDIPKTEYLTLLSRAINLSTNFN